MKEHNTILETERNALDVKATDLEASVVGKERELTGLNAQLTSVKSQNDNLVDRDSSEGHAAIGKAIEKGMQDGLSAGITHGTEGRALTDLAAYNPSAEADYISALQHLQNVNFSLLAELRSNKDANLMYPIHHLPNKVVIGATALSLALDVSNIRVQKIRENIASQRSALRDIFVPLSEPFSTKVLTGAEGTSDTVPATADTTTTLSTTLASASTITPISVDDYEVVGTDDQAGADGNAKPFPNVNDAELNIP
ncbi:hypothetical protein Tco_0928514 [Tanacetum coccineum]